MKFDHWQPGRVQGGWYGHVFVADFIGRDTGNNLRVYELGELDGGEDADLVGYAGYENGQLAKVAVVNLRLWDGDHPRNRPKGKITLNLEGVEDGTEVTVRRLTGPSGVQTSGITWAGLDWPAECNGKETLKSNTTAKAKVTGGKVNVTINATEAVLLTWETS